MRMEDKDVERVLVRVFIPYTDSSAYYGTAQLFDLCLLFGRSPPLHSLTPFHDLTSNGRVVA